MERQLTKVPAGVDLDLTDRTYGCSISTGAGAVLNEPRPGTWQYISNIWGRQLVRSYPLRKSIRRLTTARRARTNQADPAHAELASIG